ncbi:MAG: hypothetical protein JWP81_1284 [Ferruginibacter sp.]|nr:hypothetical protein [Ferruginibacter sp.]
MLVFLLLFLDVKLVVKALALIFIYLMRPDFKFGFRIKNSRLPLFYIIVLLIAIFNWIISSNFYNLNYGIALITGIAFWTACILAIHQLKLAVEINDAVIIHHTIVAFFILNILASYAIYAGIVIETGTINPFRYQGNFQKYFMGTGDYIKGITMDTSTTNAVINAFGVLYFLSKKNAAMTILCMSVLLLAASNITNILLCCIFIGLFVFASNKDQKSIIITCLMLGIIFLAKVSPQNNRYLEEAYKKFVARLPSKTPAITVVKAGSNEKEGALVTEEERRQIIARNYVDSIDNLMNTRRLKSMPVITKVDTLLAQTDKIIVPPPPIHSPSYQYKNETTVLEKQLINFSAWQATVLPLTNSSKVPANLPGKLLALQQTFHLFQQQPGKIISGAGMGNFSSKLAFRTTAMKIAGGYPSKFAYINPAFESNHFDLYLSYFTRQDKLHSLTNSPNSVYDQLLSEYGLAGIMALVIFYFGFFAKYAQILTYGIPVLLLCAGIFFVDYWFEQLSVVILFELLLFLDIRESSIEKTAADGN